jgi:hypothetical protein
MVKALLKLVARATARVKPNPSQDQECSPGVWIEGCEKLPIKKVTKTYAHTNRVCVRELQRGHFVPMNRNLLKQPKGI